MKPYYCALKPKTVCVKPDVKNEASASATRKVKFEYSDPNFFTTHI